MEPIFVAIIGVALLFNFVNGLNDAANSIATVVATRVLTPVQAVLMAAFFNLIGPLLFTTAVARTIGKGIINSGFMTLPVILVGLMVAVLWIFLSSYVGIPISATHALVGGLIGSALAYGGAEAVVWPSLEIIRTLILVVVPGGAAGAAVLPLLARYKEESNWKEYAGMGLVCGIAFAIPLAVVTRFLPLSGLLAILVFIAVSPILGFVAAFLFGLLVMRLVRKGNSKKMNLLFNHLQIGSAAFYSIGHGSNDAQNAMGVITATLVTTGLLTEFTVPLWVILISSSAISLGTFLGGWRVVETMAKKITSIRPYQGFSAETGGGVVLSFITQFGVPVSTTHAISGAIMGVGATQGYAAVQWGMVRRIVGAWIFTIPLTAAFGYFFYLGFSLLSG
jgi:PiT family inorganic phosphate transporter